MIDIIKGLMPTMKTRDILQYKKNMEYDLAVFREAMQEAEKDYEHLLFAVSYQEDEEWTTQAATQAAIDSVKEKLQKLASIKKLDKETSIFISHLSHTFAKRIVDDNANMQSDSSKRLNDIESDLITDMDVLKRQLDQVDKSTMQTVCQDMVLFEAHIRKRIKAYRNIINQMHKASLEINNTAKLRTDLQKNNSNLEDGESESESESDSDIDSESDKHVPQRRNGVQHSREMRPESPRARDTTWTHAPHTHDQHQHLPERIDTSPLPDQSAQKKETQERLQNLLKRMANVARIR